MVVVRRRWVASLAVAMLLSGCTLAGDGAVGSDPEPAASPSPTWTPGTVLPSVATCAHGPRSDSPGPGPQWFWEMGQAAMDAQSGQLVVVSSMGGWEPVQTMSFDVCTNTWSGAPNTAPWRHESWGGPAVVYDPGTDSLIALSVLESHPGQVKTYSAATRRWSQRPQTLLPWAYSVDLDRWAQLPPISFPAGFESSAVTHATLDPTSGQVLFLLESAGSRTLWSYSPGWRILRQLGGQVPAGRSGDPTLILDTSARHLVLILWGSTAGIPGETWTFDLFAQTWTDQHAEPPTPRDTSLWESRQQAVFDPVSQRTFALSNGLLSSWRSGADHWDTIVPGSDWPRMGWGTGPLSRTGHTLVHDPVNRRILVFGGSWQTDEGTTQTGDVWAYDVPTNTWTELVRPAAQEQ